MRILSNLFLRPNHLRICRTTSLQILRSRGVIRGLTNWGPFLLPRPTTKHQSQYHMGHYFILQFDSSSPIMASVRRTLELDPRMIRHSVVKIGDKLRDAKGDTAKHGAMAEQSGKVEWNSEKQDNIEIEQIVSRQGRFGASLPGDVD